MKRCVKGIAGLAKYAEVLSFVALAGMMVLVVFNCISRRLGFPIYATYDLVGFLLILIVAPALAKCAVEKGHIFLSMFTEKMPQKAQYIIEIIISLFCFAFCGVAVWALFDRALRNMDTSLTGMTTSIPVYPFIFVEAAAVFLLCLAYLADILETINKLRGVDES